MSDYEQQAYGDGGDYNASAMDPAQDPPENPQQDGDGGEAAQNLPPFRSVHTNTFPQLLDFLKCSVLVTTYQAGQLVMLRSIDGTLNTHFRGFQKPMGMALWGRHLAIGEGTRIQRFHDVPATTQRVGDGVDACFLPLAAHVTGDILIHEMGFCNEELWYVNTRFSCLCTMDNVHSFVPRWRPPFVTAYTPDDRCHLNGMAVVDGQVKYVTAMAKTDSGGGWREHKADGGICMDITANEIIAEGLSMPHSPRFYAGKLWICNSGDGSLGYIDMDTGKYETVAMLPGFTRGLTFCGRYAFVGLSQVRETAIFSGIKIVDRLKPEERWCGVVAVDLETGQQVAFVRFEGDVREVFAVQTLIGARKPDLVYGRSPLIGNSYVLPDEALKEVPEELRRPSRPANGPADEAAQAS